MFHKNAVEKSQKNLSRCTSISTIDSVLANEFILQNETSKKHPKLETDASSQSHNKMTFDNSEGIHVGDIINYYYQSPSIEVMKHSLANQKNLTKYSDSDSDIIPKNLNKSRNLLVCLPRKYILLIALISFVIIALAITFTLFMMPHKANIEEAKTTTSSTTTQTEESITSSRLTTSTLLTTTYNFNYENTTTKFASQTQTTISETPMTTVSTISTPSLPPFINLESYRSREAWNAKEPKATKELKLPIYRIILAQTNHENCSNEIECKRIIKRLQETSTHLDDIPYNFLIGDDSKIYEGRGFKFQGQHSSNKDASEYNSIGICIAFIGNYENNKPSESQMNILEEFIKYFVDIGIIVENYTIFSHDQLVKNEIQAIKLNEAIGNLRGFRNLQKIYHRDEWGAKDAKKIEKFNHTIHWALIAGNYTPKCLNFSQCVTDVRKIQQDAFERNLTDIPFAFIVGGDGLIFEGRGWDIMGEHTEDYDDQTIAIHIIDNNFTNPPNDHVINATVNLLEDGEMLGKLTNDYWINGRQELALKFKGPGPALIKVIRYWKHWNWLPKFKTRIQINF